MKNLLNWIDAQVQILTEWIWLRFLPSGQFALAGNSLAGIRVFPHLPHERKQRKHTASNAFSASTSEGSSSSKAFFADDVDALQSSTVVGCDEPHYCFMHGYPCACCGGTNLACPSGTQQGAFWPYCCPNINGESRTINFVDCCGGTTACPAGCPFCTNSVEPNWCGGAGGNIYICTLAVDMGLCGPSTS